jgi:hypothetical protein
LDHHPNYWGKQTSCSKSPTSIESSAAFGILEKLEKLLGRNGDLSRKGESAANTRI